MRIPSNKIKDIRRFMHTELCGLYNANEINVLAGVILETFAGTDRTEMYTSPGKAVSESVLLKINRAIKRLKNGEPIAYIIGYTEFCGLKFSVTPDVLIPRPETEELVRHLFEIFRFNPNPVNILDACTGSGSIAVAIKKVLPRAQIHAFDNNPKALEIAALNAAANDTPVNFFPNDLLRYTNSPPLPPLDALVCNPPYVKMSEKAMMHKNVVDYEPHNALFVPDNDPLIYYKSLAELGKNCLTKRGVLFCEINEAYGNETALLFTENGFKDVSILKDLNNKDRFVKGVWKSEGK